MNSINSISYIENTYYPAFKQKREEFSATNPPVNNYSLNGSDAIANYNIGALNISKNKPKYLNLSLSKHLKLLQKQGKKEGQDYEVSPHPIEENRVSLCLKDADGNDTDKINYINGEYFSTEIYTYRNGKPQSLIGMKKDKEIFKEKFFYRDNFSQELFTDLKINAETKPEDIIKNFEVNNIKYKIEFDGEEENNRSIWLSEFDTNGKLVHKYWWHYGQKNFDEQTHFLSYSDFNEKEKEVKRITFDKEKTGVCHFNKN